MKMEVRHGENSLTRLIAGISIFISATLTLLHSPYWALFTGLIGLTHITSAVFGFCPVERFLHHVFHMPIRGVD